MPTLERCDCQDLQDAVEECVITAITFEKAGREATIYALNHPSGDDGEAMFILFCPFCGRLAGDGLALRGEVYANN